MSVLCKKEKIVVLSHQDYIINLYSQAKKTKVEQLFDVVTPFRMDAEAEALASRLENPATHQNRKRKKNKDCQGHVFPEEVEYMKKQYKQYLDYHKETYFIGSPTIQEIRLNNKPLREHVKQVMNNVDRLFDTSAHDLMIKTKSSLEGASQLSQHYFVPEGAECHICDISDIKVHLGDNKFDLILMDPPWENKHVKRTKTSGTGYCMLENSQVQNIPVPSLLSEQGLVVIWCSNNARHRKDVASWLFTWNLTQLARWYWLKVTKYGELICDFSSHKNPYEVIIIAGKQEMKHDIEDEVVLVSVPSGIHSHKPPLDDTLQKFCSKIGERRLEIFSRYLQPNWVSVGNEACKLSHKSLWS